MQFLPKLSTTEEMKGKKKIQTQRENMLVRVEQGGPGGNAERCLSAGCKRARKTPFLKASMSRPAFRKTCREKPPPQLERATEPSLWLSRLIWWERWGGGFYLRPGVLKQTPDLTGQVCVQMTSVHHDQLVRLKVQSMHWVYKEMSESCFFSRY